MFSRRKSPSADGHEVVIRMPFRAATRTLVHAIVRPLDSALQAEGLGRVADHRTEPGRRGDPREATLTLRLSDGRRATLVRVAAILDDLGAPCGSAATVAATGLRHVFGRTEGLGLSLPVARLTEDAIAACADALGTAGRLVSGPADGVGPMLCFYGDTYLGMETKLLRLLARDARLAPATLHRLT